MTDTTRLFPDDQRRPSGPRQGIVVKIGGGRVSRHILPAAGFRVATTDYHAEAADTPADAQAQALPHGRRAPPVLERGRRLFDDRLPLSLARFGDRAAPRSPPGGSVECPTASLHNFVARRPESSVATADGRSPTNSPFIPQPAQHPCALSLP